MSTRKELIKGRHLEHLPTILNLRDKSKRGEGNAPQMNNKSKALDSDPGQWRLQKTDAFCSVRMCICVMLASAEMLAALPCPFEAYNPTIISITARNEGCHDLWPLASYPSVPTVCCCYCCCCCCCCCWIKALSARSDRGGAVGCRVKEEGTSGLGEISVARVHCLDCKVPMVSKKVSSP